MDNIWFYALSTSAQVLAALAGLFAVFVVWKIQDFEKVLSGTRMAIIQIVSYLSRNTKNYEALRSESLHSMTDSEVLKKFSELLTIKISEPGRISVSMDIKGDLISYSLDDFTEALYKNHIDKKLNILRDLKIILIANFSVIGVCVSALTFSSSVNCKLSVLTIISSAVIFCLYLIGKGIYSITAE
jgi:hypothetical protein